MKDQFDKEKYIFKSKSSYDYKQYKPNKHNENYKYNKNNEHISKSERGYNTLSDNNYSYKSRKSHSRDRSRHKSNYKEEKKIDFFEIRQRLRVEQSDLTLREMNIKNISNSLGLYQKFNKRPIDKVYDGFQWVPIENINKIEVHKPSQSILISNIPLYIDIDINDFVEFIEFYMKSRKVTLSEEEEKDILKKGVFIKGVEFNFTTNSAIVVLVNERLARNMILIDGIILYGKTLRVSPYIDGLNEENKFKGQFSLANSADLTAKSAAIALSAVNSLFKLENQIETKQKAIESDLNTDNISRNTDNHKDDNDIQNENRLMKHSNNLNNNQLFLLTKNEYQIIPSEVIKIKKFYSEGSKITKISSNDYIKLKENIVNSFGIYGKIVNLKIISSLKLLKIGVHFGDVFIEYDNINSAISVYEKYKNNEDSYRVTYIDKESLYNFVLVEKSRLYSIAETSNK